MQVYRLEDSHDELPRHWAYCEAWELSEDGYSDNRQSGFQVWGDLPSVVAAAAGAEKDGYYTENEGYKWFHVIDAEEVGDGAGEWFSVQCNAVKSVKTIEIAKLLEWAITSWNADVAGDFPGYEDCFEEWLEDSEEEVLEWLKQNTETVKPKFVETLHNCYV